MLDIGTQEKVESLSQKTTQNSKVGSKRDKESGTLRIIFQQSCGSTGSYRSEKVKVEKRDIILYKSTYKMFSD